MLAILFALLVTGTASAEVLTLTYALEETERSNLRLKAAREELGVFRGRIAQSKALPNPSVGVELEEGERIEIEQTLELPGERSLRKESAKADLAGVEALYRALEIDVLGEVRLAYYGLSLQDGRIAAARENLKSARRFLGRAEERFQSDQLPLGDVLRARVEVERARSELLTSMKERRKLAIRLNRFMGRPIRTPMEEVEPLLFQPVAIDRNVLYNHALKKRPDLRARKSQIASAAARERLAARRAWAPDLTLGLLYPRAEGKRSVGGRIALEIPLWNRFSGERTEASSLRKALETGREDMSSAAEMAVEESILDVELAAEQVELWRKAVEQARESARLALQRYEEGKLEIVALLESRNTHRDAQQSHLKALYDHAASRAGLERAVGGDLP